MNIERERPISTSIILGHGYKQPLIATAATAIGSIFCLPASFFRNIWFFLQYIAAIVCANDNKRGGLPVSGLDTACETQEPAAVHLIGGTRRSYEKNNELHRYILFFYTIFKCRNLGKALRTRCCTWS
ncbi:hypothetical protein C1H46_015530 [Malus baccata]|uniref:Uncharacterized protein n=1 Tax=Malus baccata TaxID=106549 RepID=A0A540MJB9_MALBA|nr:hypothetical protein C1H46_015530 [Malus baccata]